MSHVKAMFGKIPERRDQTEVSRVAGPDHPCPSEPSPDIQPTVRRSQKLEPLHKKHYRNSVCRNVHNF